MGMKKEVIDYSCILTLRIMCWVAGARARPACPEGVEPRMEDHSRRPGGPHGTTNHWKALGQLGALGSEWNEAAKRLARQTLHAGIDGATSLYHRRFLTRRRRGRPFVIPRRGKPRHTSSGKKPSLYPPTRTLPIGSSETRMEPH